MIVLSIIHTLVQVLEKFTNLDTYAEKFTCLNLLGCVFFYIRYSLRNMKSDFMVNGKAYVLVQERESLFKLDIIITITTPLSNCHFYKPKYVDFSC